jgi:hypothetical protein
MRIIQTLAWRFGRKAAIVTAALGADAAWNFLGAFWGFTILALAVAQIGCWMATGVTSQASTKSVTTEQRLNNVVIPRLPFPQPSSGTSGNTSFGPSNNFQTSANTSFDVGSPPTAAQFNALRDSYSNTVANFNHNVGDYGAMINCLTALRNSYSNTVSNFNALVGALVTAGIFQ